MRKRVLILAAAVILPVGVYVGCDDGGSSSGGTDSFDAGGNSFDGATAPVDSGADVVQIEPTDSGVDAGPSTSGCADGTREGLSILTYPKVAACGGTWAGDVSNAAPLCGTGWHLCDGSEPALTAVQYTDGIAAVGCFAINAAQDNNTCNHGCAAAVEAGVDTAPNIDMGAIILSHLGRSSPPLKK